MKREEIEAKYKWKLEDIYATDEAWEADYKKIEELIPVVVAYRGKLTDKANILACLKALDELNVAIEALCIYAHCRRDENQALEESNVRFGRASVLLNKMGESVSFVEPQLAALDTAVLESYVEDPDFEPYRYMIERLIAMKPYTLSEGEERLLAMTGDFAEDYGTVFAVLDNVDLDFPTVKIDGKPVKLTHGQYAFALQDSRQEVRARAFDAYYGAYAKVKNTLAANYYANVKKDVFYSKARGYRSHLDKSMLAEDVPTAVYEKLLEMIGKGLPAMHDYIAYRKDALGLDKIYMYDLYTSVVKETNLSVEFDEAADIVLKALAPLGEEYCSHIADSFRDGWIDVYETEGKRSGGYCTHAYRAPHPYVLLNYSKTTHDVFTLAHELGHAMHSYYSAHAQPASKADYKIFVAEIASTCNEMLLLDYLLKTTTDVNFKKFLLAYRLDAIRTTIFRQTMFSEFEYGTHKTVEEGQPLALEAMSDAYEALNRKYYGDLIEKDPHIRYEWMRIPHFYYNFYVYKYATGLTAAIAISERILSGDKDILPAYRKFLSAGGSKSPYEILKDCGVDLATDAPYQRMIDLFAETLAELKSL